MMRALTPVFVALLVMAGLPVADAATDATTAKDYIYPFTVDDPAGDQSLSLAPNQAYPENDVLSVEVTDDGETFVARITMGTLDFAASAGTVTIAFQTTGPGGEDWETTIIYEDGGTNLQFSEFDPSGAGDPDVAFPSPRGEVVAAENAIYLFYDFSAASMSLGGVFTIDSVSTGRGTAVGSFSNLDSVSVGGASYELQNGAFPPAPEVPDSVAHYADLSDGSAEETLTGLNATHDVYHYNFTNTASNVTFSIETMPSNGSVSVALLDQDGLSLYSNSLVSAADDSIDIVNVTAGTWSLTLNFTGFSGNVSFSLVPTGEAPTSGDGGGSDGGSDGGDGADGGSGEDSGDGNTTSDGAGGEESPGLALPVLSIGLLAVALVRRRK